MIVTMNVRSETLRKIRKRLLLRLMQPELHKWPKLAIMLRPSSSATVYTLRALSRSCMVMTGKK